jgi:hypothetical protein
MPRTYCFGCGYDYSPEQQKRLSEGKSVSCLCPPDFGTTNELEPSCARWGGGLAREGTHSITSDYGRIGRGKE